MTEDATGKDITFVLTSCGRFDLLRETLASFLEHNTAPISRYIVTEDSCDPAVRDALDDFDVDFELLFNDPPIGQMATIDRAYALVRTPYIFHCEDDWRFFRSGFIEESMVLLEANPTVSMVLCRRRGQMPGGFDTFGFVSEPETLDGVVYRHMPMWSDAAWNGYAFNPGLRRLSDYKAIGTFTEWGHEVHVSRLFKRKGMTMALLEEPACETTGEERHIEDRFKPGRLRSFLLARLLELRDLSGRR